MTSKDLIWCDPSILLHGRGSGSDQAKALEKQPNPVSLGLRVTNSASNKGVGLSPPLLVLSHAWYASNHYHRKYTLISTA